MSIDCYLDRVYDHKSYNCLHFAIEVWKGLTGQDLDALLSAMMGAAPVGKHERRQIKRLAAPCSPCIVIFQRAHKTPHIGVYVDGNVLHISERGPMFVPVKLAAFHFTSYTFYEVLP